MKKKYRKAICNSLIWIIKPFWWLFLIIAAPFVCAWILLSDWDSWLCEKFKTYDNDPD